MCRAPESVGASDGPPLQSIPTSATRPMGSFLPRLGAVLHTNGAAVAWGRWLAVPCLYNEEAPNLSRRRELRSPDFHFEPLQAEDIVGDHIWGRYGDAPGVGIDRTPATRGAAVA